MKCIEKAATSDEKKDVSFMVNILLESCGALICPQEIGSSYKIQNVIYSAQNGSMGRFPHMNNNYAHVTSPSSHSLSSADEHFSSFNKTLSVKEFYL